MVIPSYKKIHLKSDKIEDVNDQLSELNFSHSPHIIIISHLKDESESLALECLEHFFRESSLSLDVYPIYIATNLYDASNSELTLISAPAKAPQFFQQKIKPLPFCKNSIKIKKKH